MRNLADLENCKPELFFQWFQKICQIPHISYHEEKLCDFLVEYAQERGLNYVRDEMNNLLIRVPATEGYEDVQPYLLQSHMDMVAAVDEGVEFDFLHEPIQLQVVGNELRAVGTTLGADDAGGIAAMLSFVDDPSVKHPELELLFTVQEETGMNGIRCFDFSQIKSRRMVNFDSGRTHNFCVSSAGATSCVVCQQLPVEQADGDGLRVIVRDGLGGHAGLDIARNRACAVNVVGELLHMLNKQMPVRLSVLKRGGRSIFPRCDAEIVVPTGRGREAQERICRHFDVLKKRYQLTDPKLCCTTEPVEGIETALSEADSKRVIGLAFLFQTGIRKCDGENPFVILGSGAITETTLIDGHLSYEYAVRAVENSVRDQYTEMVTEMLQLLEFDWTIGKSYGGWPMKQDSEIVKRFDRIHEDVFGYRAGHQFVHGGIEVGYIVTAIPDMDAIAINLPMANAHTTKELIYIDQVPDFWALFQAVLAEK